jgi:hypothetical protein
MRPSQPALSLSKVARSQLVRRMAGLIYTATNSAFTLPSPVPLVCAILPSRTSPFRTIRNNVLILKSFVVSILCSERSHSKTESNTGIITRRQLKTYKIELDASKSIHEAILTRTKIIVVISIRWYLK